MPRVTQAIQEAVGGIREVILGRSQSYFIANYDKHIRHLHTAAGNNQFISLVQDTRLRQ